VTEPARSRFVLMGASNMTRGLAVLCRIAQRTFEAPVDIQAAVGLGRSYGLRSSMLGRALPSVLDSGLWAALAGRPSVPTVALVGDVGNDVIYGVAVPEILGWVDETLRRLKAHGARLVLTSLPPSAHTLSRAHFHIFRTFFYPARHLTYERLREAAPALERGLQDLARVHEARYVVLRPEWYGLDPIHIQPWKYRRAWEEILGHGAASCPRVGLAQSLAAFRLLPERQWMFGREMRRAQPCWRMAGGSTVSLY
jgi:Asp-tRNA(Asn)/Glu-tRNA(Gln) amidotransferase A subunit family amidase